MKFVILGLLALLIANSIRNREVRRSSVIARLKSIRGLTPTLGEIQRARSK